MGMVPMDAGRKWRTSGAMIRRIQDLVLLEGRMKDDGLGARKPRAGEGVRWLTADGPDIR